MLQLDSSKISKLKILHDTGNEIGMHGVHHYSALTYIRDSTFENYWDIEIQPGLDWFKEKLNLEISSFSYPFGERNSMTDSLLFEHFKILRVTCYSKKVKAYNVRSAFIKYSSSKQLCYGIGTDSSYSNSLEI